MEKVTSFSATRIAKRDSGLSSSHILDRYIHVLLIGLNRIEGEFLDDFSMDTSKYNYMRTHVNTRTHTHKSFHILLNDTEQLTSREHSQRMMEQEDANQCRGGGLCCPRVRA